MAERAFQHIASDQLESWDLMSPSLRRYPGKAQAAGDIGLPELRPDVPPASSGLSSLRAKLHLKTFRVIKRWQDHVCTSINSGTRARVLSPNDAFQLTV